MLPGGTSLFDVSKNWLEDGYKYVRVFLEDGHFRTYKLEDFRHIMHLFWEKTPIDEVNISTHLGKITFVDCESVLQITKDKPK